MTIQDLSESLRRGEALNGEAVEFAAEALLSADLDTEAKVDFLAALRDKGETPGEIAGFARAFLRHAKKPSLAPEEVSGPMIDVCGTGGDKLNLFNVSTTSMFVLAGAGMVVVKHGNRGITSKSGGADVLEALGVVIDLDPSAFSECVKQTGLGFLFAPLYHPAFKAVAPARKILAERGQKSIFNLIGPLLNPVQPPFQLIGVFDEELPPIYADILGQLGRQSAWAIHGRTADGRGMDEMSTLGQTVVASWRVGEGLGQRTVDHSSLGFAVAQLESLQGGDAQENAAILRAILSGEDTGPKRDIVCLNAAAALVLADQAGTLAEGLAQAAQSIDSGKALAKLEALSDFRP